MSKNIDALFFGATLENLLLAKALKQKNLSVQILCSDDQVGKYWKLMAKENPFYDWIHNFLPLTEDSKKSLQLLQELSPIEILSREEQITTKTYENSRWQNFLGFGEKTNETTQIFEQYLQSSRIRLLTPIEKLVDALEEELDENIRTYETLRSLDWQDKKISSVHSSKDRIYCAKAYFFSEPIGLIENDILAELIGKKAIQKISKSPHFHSINWCIEHEIEEVDTTDMIYLAQKGQDEAALLGGFYFEESSKKWRSQWTSFFQVDLGMNAEASGNIYRQMKRKLKRLFPNAMNHLCYESLRFWPESHAQIELDVKRKDSFFFHSGFYQTRLWGLSAQLLELEQTLQIYEKFSCSEHDTRAKNNSI